MERTEINRIKEGVDLVRVIGNYLSMEKRGAAYMALCPFHADRHPSLRIDPVKGLYHCFSCGAGGDAFHFVQQREGCGFTEAVRRCAEICHVSFSVKKVVPAVSAKAGEQRPAPSPEENERFRRSLLAYDPGMEELRETYALFGVGIAPPAVPDAYRFTARRIVFPIWNTTGELVAFAARYQGEIRDKKICKYLNSATSRLYRKGELFYGWHLAVERIRETGIVFVTEGYKDTLAMHAAGFTQTVALCGTSFSACLMEQLRSVAYRVYLLLDADETGRRKAGEFMPLLREAGLEVKDLVPEGGKDPDEMFRLLGRDAFAGWVSREMIPSGCLGLERLLVAACCYWPETTCLTDGGKEVSFLEHVEGLLSRDDLLPVNWENRELTEASVPELLRLYEVRTDPAASENVRRSELSFFLLFNYLELRLTDRIRRKIRQLSFTGMKSDETRRNSLLAGLQYDRVYLCHLSGRLGRR